VLPPSQTRYTLFPFFLAGVFFALAAPVFWWSIHVPDGTDGKLIARGHENVALYDRIYPSMQFAYTQIRAGSLPLWNPYRHCGMPFLADPLHGIYQPLNLVFLLPGTARAMAAHALIGLMLMGIGMALFLRGLDAAHAPAAIGGATYAFSGVAAAAQGFPELVAVLVWAPFFFLMIREYCRAYRARFAVFAGVAAALIVLGGSWAGAAALFAVAVPYAVIGAAYQRGPLIPNVRFRLRGYRWTVLVGAALIAPMIVPALVWLVSLESSMTAVLRFDFAAILPTRFRDLASQTLVSRADVLPRPGYIGVFALLAMPAALFHRAARFDVVYFGLAVVIALSFAIVGPIYAPAIPWEAAYLIAVFAAAVLTGLGADRLMLTGTDPRSPTVWGASALALGIAVAILIVAPNPTRGRIVLILIVLAPLVIYRVKWVGWGTGGAILLIVFLDLALSNANYYRHPFFDPEGVRGAPERVVALADAQRRGGRILVAADPLDPNLSPSLGTLYALPAAGGPPTPLDREAHAWWTQLAGAGLAAHPAPPANAEDAAAPETIAGILDHLAARVVIGAGATATNLGTLAGLRPVRTAQAAELVPVYINDDAVPRARWVRRYRVATGINDTLDALADPAFSPRKACVLDPDSRGFDAIVAQLPDIGDDSEASAPAVCTIDSETPASVTVSVTAPAPGVLVLADTYASGWTARLDDTPVPIARADGRFRAVAVPAGSHTVTFQYRPWSVYTGFGVGVAILVFTLVLGMLQYARRDRSDA